LAIGNCQLPISIGSWRYEPIGNRKSSFGNPLACHLLIVIVSFHYSVELTMALQNWIKRLGFWGFVFFLVKGLLWLTVPALIALFVQ